MRDFKGFGESIGFGKNPAVLVIDFIRGFTNSETQLGSNLEAEIKSTKKLLKSARECDVPIIFTTVAYEPHFKDGAYFIEKIPALKLLTIGSTASEIDPRLNREVISEALIVKKFASAFFGTNLSSLLNSEGIDTLIMVGCSTSGCVRASAVDGVQYGYRVVVAKDCVGDRSESAHEANIYDIETKYGDVANSKEIINYFNRIKEGDVNV